MCVSTSLYELVTGKMSHYIFCHVNPISVFASFNFNAMLKVETFWKTDHVNLSVIFVQNTGIQSRNDIDLDCYAP